MSSPGPLVDVSLSGPNSPSTPTAARLPHPSTSRIVPTAPSNLSPATVRIEVLRDFGVKDMRLAMTPTNTTMSRTPLPLVCTNHQIYYTVSKIAVQRRLDGGYQA